MMSCVTPGATERNGVDWARFSSVKVWATVLKSLFAGAALPKKNGRMLLFGMVWGPPWRKPTFTIGPAPARRRAAAEAPR